MAERGGFEPPVEGSPYDGLANRCFRPLSHLSARCLWIFTAMLPHPGAGPRLICCGPGMQGTIVQINISRGGVPKRAVREAEVTPLGLVGDEHAHPAFHGGPRKAVLLVAAEVVDELAGRGFPVFYGALGENLTTSGMDVRRLR